MTKTPDKLRTNPFWKDVYELVSHVYDKIDQLIADFPDEQWNTASKLRNAANDSMFYVSQAVGNSAGEVSEYDWNNARKNLFSLQAMYMFATKQKFLELEPEIVVKLDGLLAEAETKIAHSKKQAEKKSKEELEPWLERYRLWQKMQD